MIDPVHNRRATDSRALDIETMIAGENDPKQRAFLIVLNSINTSLMANTSTVREIGSKLDIHLTAYETHVQEESALLNQGKGMWKVGAWVVGIAQVIVIGIGARLVNDLDKIHLAVEEGQKVDAAIEQRLKTLEVRVK